MQLTTDQKTLRSAGGIGEECIWEVGRSSWNMKQSYVRYEQKTNIQEGVKNLFLLAIISCIHSLHNLNHVLVFMQITFDF